MTRQKRCGVAFWGARLKSKEVNKLRNMEGVKGIEKDIPIKDLGIVDNQDPMMFQNDLNVNRVWGSESNPVPQNRRRSKSRTPVISRPNPMRNLAFISTPRNRRYVSPQYNSFINSGRGTTGIHIGLGVDPSHRSFHRRGQSIIQKWIFGEEASNITEDGGLDDGLNKATSTCHASIIAGDPFGVVTQSELVIVKVAPTLHSFLSGLQKVVNELDELGDAFSEGRYVLSTSLGWWWEEDRETFNSGMLKFLLDELIWEFQVVVVVAAGNRLGLQGLSQNPSHFPAVLAKDDRFPMIVVGAVNPIDGRKYDWSNLMIPFPITAPGIAKCAGRNGEDTFGRGTGVATSHVAGLALYFLSLDDLGDSLRSQLAYAVLDTMILDLSVQLSVPGAVRRYIFLNSYARFIGAPSSIWNGLDPDSLPDYDWQPFARVDWLRNGRRPRS